MCVSYDWLCVAQCYDSTIIYRLVYAENEE
jgi:hypothetical protein